MSAGIVGCDLASIDLTGGITGSFIDAPHSAHRAGRRRPAATGSALSSTPGQAVVLRVRVATVRPPASVRWSSTTHRGRRQLPLLLAVLAPPHTSAAGSRARRALRP